MEVSVHAGTGIYLFVCFISIVILAIFGKGIAIEQYYAIFRSLPICQAIYRRDADLFLVSASSIRQGPATRRRAVNKGVPEELVE